MTWAKTPKPRRREAKELKADIAVTVVDDTKDLDLRGEKPKVSWIELCHNSLLYI